MAINVNTVYQTVLLILNKEQRGYMTPLEFNKTGQQSQLEIFETYFDTLNQQLRVPQADVDFSDRVTNVDEKISIFKEFGNATSISSSNVFNLPQQFSGINSTSSSTTPANTAAATTAYTIQNATVSLIATSVVQVFLGSSLLSETEYTINGLVINLNVQPAENLVITVNFIPKQFYRLGKLFYTAGALPTQELERVGSSDLYHLLSSNLTKPTTTYPIYTYKNNQITVYPTTLNSGITLSYVRKPIEPLWGFDSSAANPQYAFNPQGSVNFELHPADQTELILKILLYAGVVVKSPEIIQVAAQQVAQENINQQR